MTMDPSHDGRACESKSNTEFLGCKSGVTSCEVCNVAVSLYRCPKCSMRTCSLQCCKIHKEKINCNGRRDRTAFIALNQFSDANMLSDYHFLEDVLQNSSRAKRLRTELGATNQQTQNDKENNKKMKLTPSDSFNHSPNPVSPLLTQLREEKSTDNETKSDQSESHDPSNNNNNNNSLMDRNLQQNKVGKIIRKKETNPDWLSTHSGMKKKLVHNAQSIMRNVHLLLMPKGMTRHKQNTSRFDVKKDCFFWRVEFIFHIYQIPFENNTPSIPEMQHIQLKLPINRMSERSVIRDELSNLMETSKSLKPYLKQFNIDHKQSDIFMYLKKIPSTSKKNYYKQLDKYQTLQTALNGMTIIEFPTIEVLLQKEYQLQFPTIIKEIINDTKEQKLLSITNMQFKNTEYQMDHSSTSQ